MFIADAYDTGGARVLWDTLAVTRGTPSQGKIPRGGHWEFGMVVPHSLPTQPADCRFLNQCLAVFPRVESVLASRRSLRDASLLDKKRRKDQHDQIQYYFGHSVSQNGSENNCLP